MRLSESVRECLEPLHESFGRGSHRGQSGLQEPVAADDDDRDQDPPEDFLEPDPPAPAPFALFAPGQLRRRLDDPGGLDRGLIQLTRHALTNGTLGTVRTPPPPLPPDPFGFTDFFVLDD